MTLQVKTTKDHFLTPEQKRIKFLVMERLMGSFFHVLSENQEVEFSAQSLADLILSSIIMFSRDQLVNFFLNSSAIKMRDKLMTEIFNTIRFEVNQAIVEEIKKKKVH